MLILGVDTSGKHGSIALVECDATAFRTLELVPLQGGTFSAQLVPQIAALLQVHRLSKNQIEAFAVVSGPGSFTGLRVGLAATKALAEILQKPIVPVSLLEAVALAPRVNGRLTAVLDAGRGEIYVGVYDVQGSNAICASEGIVSANPFPGEVAGNEVVTPDEKMADLLRNGSLAVHKIQPPQADGIAAIGFRKLQAGETVSPEALDATYIRRSEAEIKFAERSQ